MIILITGEKGFIAKHLIDKLKIEKMTQQMPHIQKF